MDDQLRKIYKFGEFQLDAKNRQLNRENNILTLSPKALDLLLILVENSGRLISKDELFERVWQEQIVEESNLTVHISQIRKTLGESKQNPRFIETVSGYGYRFLGEVSNFDESEFVLETETFSRITIESENTEGSDMPVNAGSSNFDNARTVSRSEVSEVPGSKGFLLKFSAAGAVVVVLLAGLFYWNFYSGKIKHSFERVKLSRLTNNGRVSLASFSQDGKFVAYVLSEPVGNSLWVRQTGIANDKQVLPPTKSEFWGLTFTPDGNQIYYNLFSGDKTDIDLYKIPALGGVPQKIPDIIAYSVSFSPDGKKIAFIQSDSASNRNHLVIADADGRNARIVSSKPQPNTFIFHGDFTAWSPDGETIACLINLHEPEFNYGSIIGVNVSDGSEKSLSNIKWHDVASFEWIKDGSGLLVSGSKSSSERNQIWFVSSGSGEARIVVNDLHDYYAIHTTENGDSFVALQTTSLRSISVGGKINEDFSPREIVAETGVLNPLAWKADSGIIYRSNADGKSNLWIMDELGANRRQITADAGVTTRGMCATPDGKYIVFVSWRGGKANLWRVNSDGDNLTQLTNGDADAYPSCSPDGQTVVYQHGIISQPYLMKVSMRGGEPERLTEFQAKWSAVSSDGKFASFFQMADAKWQIGIISIEGGEIIKKFNVPPELKESKTLWSPDDRFLYFIGASGNVGNLWKLSLEDGKPEQVTNFNSQYLDDFGFSPDGEKLIVAQSRELSDVVLFEDVAK